MAKTPQGSATHMDKAIERAIDKETGASASSPPLAADDRDDPVARGAQANSRQHHQGEARHDTDMGSSEVPTMDGGGGKTGKADKGGKQSGADAHGEGRDYKSSRRANAG